MRKNIFILLVPIYFLLYTNALYSQIDYSEFDFFLQKVVKEKNVDYRLALENKDVLVRLTNSMSEISPDSHPDKFKTRNDELSYWINAYNAFILKIVMENYPVDSIKDINFIGFTIWLHKNLIGGEEISFKSLEDDIIRERYQDPRIHFAINCASFSCPPLKNKAYIPELLDKQLDESTRSFINDENNFRIDSGEGIVYLSSIFDWYDDDFFNWLNKNKNIQEPHLLDFIKLYYDDHIIEGMYSMEIEFIDYNWQLNDSL